MVRSLVTVGLVGAMALMSAATFSAQTPPAAAKTAAAKNTIIFDTSKGQIEIETLPGDAPKSVERFVELAKRGFYREQRFHWVQSNLVQAGDPYSRDMSKMQQWGKGGSGKAFALRPVGVAETSKRPFTRGIVGLAYVTGSKPESADCQFFILRAAGPALDGKYAVIGRVTKGLAVVDKIEKTDVIKMVTVK
jgi:cyclophilin family peptidyl-prolyl cis-trans isomerase